MASQKLLADPEAETLNPPYQSPSISSMKTCGIRRWYINTDRRILRCNPELCKTRFSIRDRPRGHGSRNRRPSCIRPRFTYPFHCAAGQFPVVSGDYRSGTMSISIDSVCPEPFDVLRPGCQSLTSTRPPARTELQISSHRLDNLALPPCCIGYPALSASLLSHDLSRPPVPLAEGRLIIKTTNDIDRRVAKCLTHRI